ncbi:hypothetical protein SAMN05192583_1404 [Sphingomonas gellani]|uniref:Uncharacterized protein n=1 Tax=Sphingomonas gellani TaxID=1166340 RepID=A0A1H8C0A1_9SPHN|nr:hypothetical protein [Sphingomonas gellani]SEM88611.1 hypothetical protein SAMN05192583_1404 [Sphingomonas gellani]
MTVTIDDPAAGGSAPGAWATAIAHTPSLAAQTNEITRGALPCRSARAGEGQVTAASPSPDEQEAKA